MWDMYVCNKRVCVDLYTRLKNQHLQHIYIPAFIHVFTETLTHIRSLKLHLIECLFVFHQPRVSPSAATQPSDIQQSRQPPVHHIASPIRLPQLAESHVCLERLSLSVCTR